MITITNPRRGNGRVLERCSGQTDNRRRSCSPPAMGHDAKDVACGRPAMARKMSFDDVLRVLGEWAACLPD